MQRAPSSRRPNARIAGLAIVVGFVAVAACKNKKGKGTEDPDDLSAQAALDGGKKGRKGKKGEPPPPPNPNMKTMRVDDSRCNPDGKRTAQQDLNHDNRADIVTLYTSAGGADRISCKQVDVNFDGQLDAFYHYDEGGEVEREQYDLDFDGRIDTGRYFTNGELSLQELDLNQDGYVDAWRHYDKSRLVRIETDRDGDGTSDMYQYFVAGQIDRIGYDVDGDGKVDQWDHDAARRARLALERRQKKSGPAPVSETEYVDEPAGEGEAGEGEAGEGEAGKGEASADKDGKDAKDSGKASKGDK